MRGFFVQCLGLVALMAFTSCASRQSGASGGNVIASTQVSGNPIEIFQTTTEVMGRYSYSVSRVQFPTSATYEKTGNSINQLANSSPAFLTLQVQQTGSGYRLSFSGESGTFKTDAVKGALEEIRKGVH